MIRGRSVILVALGCLSASWAVHAQTTSHLDPSQPMENRIADLVSRMTLEEKAAELNHLSSRNGPASHPRMGRLESDASRSLVKDADDFIPHCDRHGHDVGFCAGEEGRGFDVGRGPRAV